MNLESLYQDLILDHYKNPINKKLLDNPQISVHHINPSCGDEITLNLDVHQDILKVVAWDGVGCSISQASTSVMSDLVQGRSFLEAETIFKAFMEMMQSKGGSQGDEEVLGDAIAFSGVSKFPARIKCALLGWMALKDAIIQIDPTSFQGKN